MSKEMREQINNVKNWEQFLNEQSLKGAVDFERGKLPSIMLNENHKINNLFKYYIVKNLFP